MQIPDRTRKAFTGILLTESLAIRIYSEKLRLIGGDDSSDADSRLRITLKGQSKRVADRFGVSPKTIRDIWSRLYSAISKIVFIGIVSRCLRLLSRQNSLPGPDVTECLCALQANLGCRHDAPLERLCRGTDHRNGARCCAGAICCFRTERKQARRTHADVTHPSADQRC